MTTREALNEHNRWHERAKKAEKRLEEAFVSHRLLSKQSNHVRDDLEEAEARIRVLEKELRHTNGILYQAGRALLADGNFQVGQFALAGAERAFAALISEGTPEEQT